MLTEIIADSPVLASQLCSVPLPELIAAAAEAHELWPAVHGKNNSAVSDLHVADRAK